MTLTAEPGLTLREGARFAGVPLKRIEKSAAETKAGTVKRVGRRNVTTISPVLVIYEATLANISGARFNITMKKRFLSNIQKLPKKTSGTKMLIDNALELRLMPEVVERYRQAVDYIARKQAHLESRADIFGGEVVIKGTRIPARFVADVVNSGGSLDDFCEDYSDIPRMAFETAIEFADYTPRMGRPQTLRPKDATRIAAW